MTDQSAELIRNDRHRRLRSLEHVLIAAARGPKVEIDLAEIESKGLLVVLRAKLKGRRLNRAQRPREIK